MSSAVTYYVDRQSGRLIEESIAAKGIFHWLYNSQQGKRFAPFIFQSPMLHRMVELYCDSTHSKRLIPTLLNNTQIALDEMALPLAEYTSLNHFFARRLTGDCRPMDLDPDVLVAPGDGKLLIIPEIDDSSPITVKNVIFTLEQLLADTALARHFNGGCCSVLRLYIGDYHRIHFPASGIPARPKAVPGYYYSVSPIAGNEENFYCRNQRTSTLFHSDQFGLIAFVDVGGFLIASIRATFKPGTPVQKGAEKSYFAFGGSTTVMIHEPNRLVFDDDLLKNSAQGVETSVKLGTKIALKKG